MKGHGPPNIFRRFLNWFCDPDLLIFIEGDLYELYYERLKSRGKKYADYKFIRDVMLLFRPGIIRSFLPWNSIKYSFMLKHSFLMIWRDFIRNKFTFLINMIGLTLGCTTVFLIFLWVQDEYSMGYNLENKENLYQVLQNTPTTNGIETIEATSGLLAESLLEEIPEINHAATVIPSSFNVCKGIIVADDRKLSVDAQFVSEQFFDVFPFQFATGYKDSIILDKKNVVISQSLAIRLFGEGIDPIGRQIEWSSPGIAEHLRVGAVFEDPSFQYGDPFDIVLSLQWYVQIAGNFDWNHLGPRSYITTRSNVQNVQLNEQIAEFLISKGLDSQTTLYAQKYSDRYLYNTYENGSASGGRIQYVRLFILFGSIILLIALVNFVNLSAARQLKNIRNVGIRKAIGAGQRDLILQFFIQPFVQAMIAVVLSVGISYLLLDSFNLLTGKSIQIKFDFSSLGLLLGLALFTGLFAGLYPAIRFPRYKPVFALKNAYRPSKFNSIFGRSLVIFQFTVSSIFIFTVLLVYQQLQYIHTKDLGFNRTQMIYLDVKEMSQSIMNEVKGIPGVINAGGGNLIPGKQLGGTSGISWDGMNSDQNEFFSIKWVGTGLIETLEMQILKGSSFNDDMDLSRQVILNETAVKKMGSELDPVGTTVKIEDNEYKVIGVVKDFYFESLYDKIEPCLMLAAPIEYAPTLSIKIQAGQEKEVINQLESIFSDHFPDETFSYRFMVDDYNRLYSSESKLVQIAGYMMGLSILISCLGLFGLAMHSSQQRLKEISIRKVLGSKVSEIIILLSRTYINLVVLSLVIAIPICYWISQKWLSDFAYHTTLSWRPFGVVIIVMIVLTVISIGWQVSKVARVNPSMILSED